MVLSQTRGLQLFGFLRGGLGWKLRHTRQSGMGLAACWRLTLETQRLTKADYGPAQEGRNGSVLNRESLGNLRD
jgi:hypothetical protein